MAITKATLIATLNQQNAQLIEQGRIIEALRQQLGDAQHMLASANALRSDLVDAVVHAPKVRPAVPVYEWDATKPGDFQRALHLAKINNGRTQRVRQGSPS